MHLRCVQAYFPVAIAGYTAFGNAVDADVLLSVGRPAWLTRAANAMVVVHVIASWQVRASWGLVQIWEAIQIACSRQACRGPVTSPCMLVAPAWLTCAANHGGHVIASRQVESVDGCARQGCGARPLSALTRTWPAQRVRAARQDSASGLKQWGGVGS